MSDKWLKILEQLTSALSALYKANLPLPYLMLLYTAIDIFAYIWAGDGLQVGERFRAFCEKYIVKHLSGVAASDLWGARCAILHTASPKSFESKRGKAREVLYSWGSGRVEIAEQVIKESFQEEKYIAVKIESLADAFSEGVVQLARDMAEDPLLAADCGARITQAYTMIPIPKVN